MNLKLFLKILMFLICIQAVFAQEILIQKSPEDNRQKITASIDQCEKIKSYIVKNKYDVQCTEQYFYFASNTQSFKNATDKNQLKIANYNLLHPGTSKALFKDYSLVAKIANSFDIVAAEELLSLVAHDLAVNNAIDSALLGSNDQDFIKSAKNIYRQPGYLKLLGELKKLDPSWSLILSPRGDAALQGSVEEYVGFYFRNSLVKIKNNPYCQSVNKNIAKSNSFACLLNFGEKNKFVSRRPFMATFKAQNFQFTLIASHVVYNFSGNDEQVTDLVKGVFNKNSVAEIGEGVNSNNVARFAEVKLAQEFIKNYIDTFKDKKVIYLADTNLTPELDYWAEILKINSGSELLINEATTISPQKFNKSNEETNGVASSYDHFIINKEVFNTCDNGHVYKYYDSPIQLDIEKTYMIREINQAKIFNLLQPELIEFEKDDDIPPIEDENSTKLDYPLTKTAENKMNQILMNYKQFLSSQKTVKNNQISLDDFQINERVDGLKNRVFIKQLTNSFYYRFYQELLSDHFPVYISCKI